MTTLPPPNTIELDSPPTPKDYYILEVYSLDWVWMINKFFQKNKHLKPEDGFVAQSGDWPIYFFRKDAVTAEQIAGILGATAEEVTKSQSIQLKRLGDQTKWEKPTVNYFGEA